MPVMLLLPISAVLLFKLKLFPFFWEIEGCRDPLAPGSLSEASSQGSAFRFFTFSLGAAFPRGSRVPRMSLLLL